MLTSNEIYQTITPHKKKKTIIFAIFIGICCILVFTLYFFMRDSKTLSYITIKPVRGTIVQTVSATGVLSPTNELEVGSQISGTIYKLYVEVNDVVKEGEVLAEINPNKLMQTYEGYEAQLQSALAGLEYAKLLAQQKAWYYKTQKKLYDATGGKSPSFLDLENARLEYLSASADIKIKQANINQIQTNLKASQIDLQNAIIRSPIDGIVLERSVSVGSTVAANFSSPMLFKLAQDLADMSLIVNISESDIGKVKVGQMVEFSVDAYPSSRFQAKVDRVNFVAKVTENITSYETTIYVDNEKLLLKPGMSASAFIQVAKEEDTLLVPVSAIYYNPENEVTSSKTMQNPLLPMRQRTKKENAKKHANKQIWILKDGLPHAIPVEIGISDSKMVAITSDLLDDKSEIIVGHKE